jgi:hypothetical protein
MEAEEVEALASLRQVHDPRLGPFQLKPRLRQGRPRRHKGSLGLWRQVSKSDPTDLYEQVAAEIARAIADREAKPGSGFPRQGSRRRPEREYEHRAAVAAARAGRSVSVRAVSRELLGLIR